MPLAIIRGLLSDNGRLVINFRTHDNWFYGLGNEVEPNTYLLDARAGSYEGYVFTFLTLDQLKAIVAEAGLRILSIERLDLWRSNMTQQHSWFICELAP